MLFRRSTRGGRQVGEGPVKIRAIGLLHHLRQAIKGQVGGAQADQGGDLIGVFAQVTAQGKHRRGRPDRVAELVPGELEPEPDLQRLGQDLERRHLGRDDVDAAVLDLPQRLPVERIHPRRPVRPLQRVAAVLGERLDPQLEERHLAEPVPPGDALLAVKERPLLHERLQILLGGVARGQLTQVGQELILQGRPGRRHRPDVETDRGVAERRARRPRGQGRDQHEWEHQQELPLRRRGPDHFRTVTT